MKNRTFQLDQNKKLKIISELDKNYFEGESRKLAQELLGKIIINQENNAAGLIVETEAYIGEKDPACHLSYGNTERNQPFFKGKGTIYVFTIYQHKNINIITQNQKHPECILIRAIEPLTKIPEMKKRRNKEKSTEIGSGPGKLTQALEIGLKHNNTKLDNSKLSIFNTNYNPKIRKTKRIGISKAEDWPLRYTIKNNPHVSKSKSEGTNQKEIERIYQEIKQGEFKYEVK